MPEPKSFRGLRVRSVLLTEYLKLDPPFEGEVTAACFSCEIHFEARDGIGVLEEIAYADSDESNLEYEFLGALCELCSGSVEFMQRCLWIRSMSHKERCEEHEEALRALLYLEQHPAELRESGIFDAFVSRARWHHEQGEFFDIYAYCYLETPGAKIKAKGFVYLLGSPEGYCKIGRTVNLKTRFHAIGLQLPFRLEVLHTIEVSDPVKAERFLHEKFKDCRANGEWFLLSVEQINWIRSQISLEGLY